tara:strand:- start:36 stop:620 length:585 start_codon:yes stop_codon:yes gene_type:complete
VQSLLTKPTTGVGTIILDLESNGLLNNASRIHCIALHYCDNDLTEAFNDEKYSNLAKELPMGNRSLTTGITSIEIADAVVGHNIIGFDLPLIKRLYPFFTYPPVIVDTLLLSRLYHPNLYDIDKRHEWKDMPTKLYGSHSLEAYGYRLGLHKGDFGKDTDWKEWSQDMQDYCIQDVMVTKKLCDHFHPYLIGSR